MENTQLSKRNNLMKRFPIAITIFIITIGICVFGLFYSRNKKNDFSETLENAYKQAQNGQLDAAKASVEKFEQDWNKSEKYLMLFIHKDDLNEIEFSSRAILEYINAKELPEFYAETKRIMALLDHLWEAEAPTFKNIL